MSENPKKNKEKSMNVEKEKVEEWVVEKVTDVKIDEYNEVVFETKWESDSTTTWEPLASFCYRKKNDSIKAFLDSPNNKEKYEAAVEESKRRKKDQNRRSLKITPQSGSKKRGRPSLKRTVSQPRDPILAAEIINKSFNQDPGDSNGSSTSGPSNSENPMPLVTKINIPTVEDEDPTKYDEYDFGFPMKNDPDLNISDPVFDDPEYNTILSPKETKEEKLLKFVAPKSLSLLVSIPEPPNSEDPTAPPKTTFIVIKGARNPLRDENNFVRRRTSFLPKKTKKWDGWVDV
ncbi:hypothetical protein L5515_015517 [Caenorhabditis briggsae]|uniref:Chromo domain-containing protein n=1 Tax=Caenorhabditis briggsae TaxID=6238 RepID=A0AAE9EC00_CAEBR|nr:hypothetical protein L5515_015517 [Caenorhabditis briggsae]